MSRHSAARPRALDTTFVRRGTGGLDADRTVQGFVRRLKLRMRIIGL